MPRHRTRSGLTRVDLLVIIAMLTSVQSDKGLGAAGDVDAILTTTAAEMASTTT